MDEAAKKVGAVLIVVVVLLAWAWPRGSWHNERSESGQCLAWRVTEYAGGMFTSIDHGPHVVEQKWC